MTEVDCGGGCVVVAFECVMSDVVVCVVMVVFVGSFERTCLWICSVRECSSFLGDLGLVVVCVRSVWIMFAGSLTSVVSGTVPSSGVGTDWSVGVFHSCSAEFVTRVSTVPNSGAHVASRVGVPGCCLCVGVVMLTT